MRYLKVENPYIICRFTTGDTVTIDIYDLADNSKDVDGASMTEIGTTGYFKYQFNPDISVFMEYLYIADNGIEEHAGKIILGGYPDDVKDGLTDIKGTGFVKDTDSLVDIRPETGKIQAVKDKTDNLPPDPADQSLVEAAISTRAPSGEYDTEMARIDQKISDTESNIRGADSDDLKTLMDAISAAGSWTDDELKQIRDALGIDGIKIESTGGSVQNTYNLLKKVWEYLPTAGGGGGGISMVNSRKKPGPEISEGSQYGT